MSDYGADSVPDMTKSQLLADGLGLLQLGGTNVMQWTYKDGEPRVVRKLAKGGKHTNILFLLKN